MYGWKTSCFVRVMLCHARARIQEVFVFQGNITMSNSSISSHLIYNGLWIYRVKLWMYNALFCTRNVITARKRSLRRLCFYRCVSVHRGGSPSGGGGFLDPGGVLHPVNVRAVRILLEYIFVICYAKHAPAFRKFQSFRETLQWAAHLSAA